MKTLLRILFIVVVASAVAIYCTGKKPDASERSSALPVKPQTLAILGRAVDWPASVVKGTGDSITVVAYATLSGPADSVKLMIADSGTSPHFKPDTTVWRSPVPTVLNVIKTISASPPYNAGTRYVIRFRWIPYTNVAGATTTAFASFVPTAPTPPPPGSITVDSVRVIPTNWTGYPGQKINATVITFLKNGSMVTMPKTAVAGIKPGKHYLVAVERSEVPLGWGRPGDVLPPGAHSDTLWLNILPGGINEPAGYVAFARSNGDSLPLPYPKKVINKPEWMGLWSQFPTPDPDLTLQRDTMKVGDTLSVLTYVKP